jgi:hypothetical protein
MSTRRQVLAPRGRSTGVGGAGRAISDPVLTRIRELASPGIIATPWAGWAAVRTGDIDIDVAIAHRGSDESLIELLAMLAAGSLAVLRGPGVERRAAHIERPAHSRDRVVELLRFDHRAAIVTISRHHRWLTSDLNFIE